MRIWEAVDVAYENFCKSIPTNQLNVWLGEIREGGHTVSKGKAILQHEVRHPNGNVPAAVHVLREPPRPGQRQLRALPGESPPRKSFDLTGTPIRMKFKKKD